MVGVNVIFLDLIISYIINCDAEYLVAKKVVCACRVALKFNVALYNRRK